MTLEDPTEGGQSGRLFLFRRSGGGLFVSCVATTSRNLYGNQCNDAGAAFTQSFIH